MQIRRVFVPFTDAEGMEPVAEAAFVVGQLMSAQVRGLLVVRGELSLPVSGEYSDPSALRRIADSARQNRTKLQKRAQDLFQSVEKRFKGVDAAFDCREGDPDALVAHAARLADLSVIGIRPPHADDVWAGPRDAALFRSGRPVLFIPPAGVEERQFERLVIGWKDGIEAARAVAAAEPFLLKASEVHLASVAEGANATASLQEVERYLQLHHPEVRSEAIPSSSRPVAEILLDRAEALGGALLAMGAYGHRRWQEQLFGGATEYVLRNARTPVLMSH